MACPRYFLPAPRPGDLLPSADEGGRLATRPAFQRFRTNRRVDVSNDAGFGGVKLRRQIHHEVWQPWYGSGMNALRQSKANGGPARNGARLVAEYDDGLYRYVPVPPVFPDAEGCPVEDGMSQNEDHQKETAYWCDVLQRRFPEATVCSDLPVHYRRGDGNRAVVSCVASCTAS